MSDKIKIYGQLESGLVNGYVTNKDQVEGLAYSLSNLDSAIKNKVDKIEGKGLSTEDFTAALKQKLESLNNFDSSQIENSISQLQTQINTLVSREEVETAFTEFSGIVLQSILAKADKTPVITLDDISKVTLDWDKEYHFTLTKDTSVVLYDKPNDDYAHSIEIEITTGEETYSFNTNLEIQWVKDLEIEPNKRYMIIIDDSMTAMWTAVERSEQ